jgi:Spy/CpxP family protein refolding chaperone
VNYIDEEDFARPTLFVGLLISGGLCSVDLSPRPLIVKGEKMRTSYIAAGLTSLALAFAISLPAGAQSSAGSPSPQTAPSQTDPQNSPSTMPQAAPQSEPTQAPPSAPEPAASAPQPQKADQDNPLNLTDEQKAKLRPIVADENQQLNAVQNDASLTPEQKNAKANEIRQTATPKIKAILTPEQLQKLAQLQQEKLKEQQGNQGGPTNSQQSPQK